MSEYCYQCTHCGQFKEYCKCQEFQDPMAMYREGEEFPHQGELEKAMQQKGMGHEEQKIIKQAMTSFEKKPDFNLNKTGGKNKMESLKKTAQDYVPKQTLNIADLDRTNLNWKVESRTGTTTKKDAEGVEHEETYTYSVMVVNEQEYRVPLTVLEEIQKMLKLKPDLEFVNVSRTGSGMATRYSVEALIEENTEEPAQVANDSAGTDGSSHM